MNSYPLLTHTMRTWRQLNRRRKWQLYGIVALMLVASVVEVFSIGAVVPFLGVLASPQQVFEHAWVHPFARFLGVGQPRGLIVPATILFCVAAILSGALRYLLLHVQTRLTYSIGVDLSVKIFERTLYQPYLVHVSRNSSEVIAGVSNKANELIVGLLFPMATFVSSFVMLMIVFGALLLVEPLITLLTVVAFSAFYGCVLLISRRKLSRSSQIMAKQYGNVIKLIQEGLGGIRDILLDGTQRTFLTEYHQSERALRTERATVQIMSGTPRFVVETLGTLFIALLAMFLTTSPEGLGRAIPVLGVVALAAQRLVPVMQQLYSSWAAIAGGRASVSDALDLLEQSMEEERRMPSGSLPFLTEIRLENLSFAYSPSLPEVLHCVDLIIPKGSRLGIIGETGSGKSTFLDIVMGLLPPTRGQMKVDGAALTPDRMPVWQRQIAHVPQSIFLADTTVAENIAFGLPPDEIDHDRVVTAAVIAQVDEVIRALPSGYQTRVGERGVRLSGGQRQRLGIARALYKQASVIVLDEATSALDHETERAVMDAIHSLPEKITLLIVAHRYSTLQECNSVIRLRNGGLEKVQDFKSVLVGQGSSSEE